MSSGTANKEGKQQQKRNRFITLLRKYPGISRQRCAEIMQLSTFSISRLTRDLINANMVIEDSVTETATETRLKGRPSQPLYLNPDYAHFAGIDFEASHWRFLIINFQGQAIYQTERLLNECRDSESYTQILEQYLETEIARYGAPWSRVQAVGVAAPGLLDLQKGIIREYEACPAIGSIPILERYRRITQKPVYLLHNMSSLAIYHIWHYPESIDKVVYHVGLRSGIGSEISDHGRIYTGNNNRAGEIGYFPVLAPGSNDRILHLDHVSGLLALGRKLPNLNQQFWNGQADAVEEVLRENKNKKILHHAMQSLAQALAGISAVLDPGEIIVYSPLLSTPNQLWSILETQFFRFLDPVLAKNKKILRSTCSSFAPANGAALHAAGEAFPTHLGELFEHSRRQALLNTPVPHLWAQPMRLDNRFSALEGR